jgi:hypothetical protein
MNHNTLGMDILQGFEKTPNIYRKNVPYSIALGNSSKNKNTLARIENLIWGREE